MVILLDDNLELSGSDIYSKEPILMAAQYNITINKNADFSRTFALKTADVTTDITGYTFAGTLKPTFHSDTSVSFTAVVTDALQGLFSIKLTDTQTADMTPGDWVWDLVQTDTAGLKTRLLEGQAFVKPGVTA